MQSGEIIITGHNSIHIPLRKMPAEVSVRFKKPLECIPCNPNVDSLEYQVHVSRTHHGGFDLVIKWKVEGVREVIWEAFF